MAENPLISVIIPVYNVAPYLAACLDSVVSQTYRNLEILLIDDGSTDKSGAICDEYATKDLRIKVVHQANGGVSAARNKGLEIAQGEYIGFVDPDDLTLPQMYETLLDFLRRDKADVSACRYQRFYPDGSIQAFQFPQDVGFIYDTPEQWLRSFIKWFNIHSSVWNKLFTKKLLQKRKISFFPKTNIIKICLYMLQAVWQKNMI